MIESPRGRSAKRPRRVHAFHVLPILRQYTLAPVRKYLRDGLLPSDDCASLLNGPSSALLMTSCTGSCQMATVLFLEAHAGQFGGHFTGGRGYDAMLLLGQRYVPC